MSDFDFDDDEPGAETQGVAALRAAYKKLQKEHAALSKENGELKGAQRTATVKSLVEAKGLNPKIAALIPADVQGEDAVGKWIDDWADVFGIQTTDQPPAGMTPDDVAAAQKIATTTQGSEAGPAGSVDAAIAAIGKAQTQEEIDALLANAINGLRA